MQEDKNRKIEIIVGRRVEIEEDSFEEDTRDWTNKDLVEFGEAYVKNSDDLKRLVDSGLDVMINVIED